MKILRRAAIAAAISATPLLFAPAFAAEMHNNMDHDDAMAGDAMHPMMHADIDCTAGMSDTGGLMIEFHNMGKDEVPAGTMAHWMVSGVAQGDVNFMEAVAAGGMKSQNYAMAGDDHMMHMPSNAHCTAEIK